MTDQELFDKVVLGVAAQGRKSHRGGQCKFRSTDEGGRVLKCAAGFLIPDEVYTPEMERTGLIKIASTGGVEFLPNQAQLVSDLMEAHDSAHEEFREDFLASAARVAIRFGLAMPEIP